jgi:hypothetical protein
LGQPGSLHQILKADPIKSARPKKAACGLEFEISLPPLDWQDEVVRLGHRIADVKKLQEATSLGLDAFLPSIFDEAFHGTH